MTVVFVSCAFGIALVIFGAKFASSLEFQVSKGDGRMGNVVAIKEYRRLFPNKPFRGKASVIKFPSRALLLYRPRRLELMALNKDQRKV